MPVFQFFVVVSHKHGTTDVRIFFSPVLICQIYFGAEHEKFAGQYKKLGIGV